MPERIQLSRKKGWRKPESTVVVSRPSKWGNPWKVGDDDGGGEPMTRSEAVDRFRARASSDASLIPLLARTELAGKNLACWCPLVDPDGNRVPCHADVLLELANPS